MINFLLKSPTFKSNFDIIQKELINKTLTDISNAMQKDINMIKHNLRKKHGIDIKLKQHDDKNNQVYFDVYVRYNELKPDIVPFMKSKDENLQKFIKILLGEFIKHEFSNQNGKHWESTEFCVVDCLEHPE